MTPKQPMIHSNPRLPLPKRIFAVVSMEKAEALAGGQQLQKIVNFWLLINHKSPNGPDVHLRRRQADK